jgi:hypothetical protein
LKFHPHCPTTISIISTKVREAEEEEEEEGEEED